ARCPSTRTYPREDGPYAVRSHRWTGPDRFRPGLPVVVGRVADPELAVEVGAPAVRHRLRGQHAAVPVTGGDRHRAGERPVTVPVAHRHRQPPVGTRLPVAELSVEVGTPAADRAVGSGGAGVVVTGDDAGHARQRVRAVV